MRKSGIAMALLPNSQGRYELVCIKDIIVSLLVYTIRLLHTLSLVKTKVYGVHVVILISVTLKY